MRRRRAKVELALAAKAFSTVAQAIGLPKKPSTDFVILDAISRNSSLSGSAFAFQSVSRAPRGLRRRSAGHESVTRAPCLFAWMRKDGLINESGRGRGKGIYADVTRGLALDWKKQRQSKAKKRTHRIPESDIPSGPFFPPSSSRPITSHHITHIAFTFTFLAWLVILPRSFTHPFRHHLLLLLRS